MSTKGQVLFGEKNHRSKAARWRSPEGNTSTWFGLRIETSRLLSNQDRPQHRGRQSRQLGPLRMEWRDI